MTTASTFETTVSQLQSLKGKTLQAVFTHETPVEDGYAYWHTKLPNGMVFDWLRDGITFQFDDKSSLHISATFAEFGGLGFAFNADAPNKNTPTISTVEAPGRWKGYLNKSVRDVELIVQNTRFKTDLIEYPQDLVLTLEDDNAITIVSANFYDHTDTIADPGSELIVCRGEQETQYFSLGKHRPG